ncbi:DUF3108 domain-containing protein [Moheibacter lacus]|uniref:DUF3108 domain-containing protein n=1 Tax=Moheibacter lacus TaxID=2745851 RepID=A0A838ZSC4_9FLAO|nr:DUF3108 domain-containing protein [Moheibacter lacus]MBA5629399.1 DUF3108 domain-containing protein [Moheibacter lacus]
MKKTFLIAFASLLLLSFVGSESQNYKDGEFLKYRIHYGLLNAGFATLEVKNTTLDGKPHFHVIGEGSSSGAVRAFYKVDDRYESYINQETDKPSKFVRKISEGGYERDQVFTFDHGKKIVKINDKRNQKVTYRDFEGSVQDLLSAFYYLRNYDTDKLATGDFINVNILMADETYKFKLKILGRETMNTKFGKIKTIKIRPYVQSGRIFKESESVTMWVTDDKNHVPIQIKAELTVGSLKADLHSYKNTKYTLHFTK